MTLTVALFLLGGLTVLTLLLALCAIASPAVIDWLTDLWRPQPTNRGDTTSDTSTHP